MSVNASTELARWLVDQLVSQGLSDAVICPGSRDAPLLFAFARDPRVRTHSRIDERTAGFLALGLAKTQRRPVAVVTTSGTAVANLHPAVLEAAHAAVPLVVLSADRPAALRGTGANQTTDQVGLFGPVVVTTDLSAPEGALVLPRHGPCHLNAQFADPLLPDDEENAGPPGSPVQAPVQAPGPRHDREAGPEPVFLQHGSSTVVVAGDDSGNRARLLAEQAGWPLLAEPTSGSRNGSAVIRSYRLLLGTPLAERIERVVVFGHPTLSRPVSLLMGREDLDVVSVRARGWWAARPFPVAAEHDSVTTDGRDESIDAVAWHDQWRSADRACSRRIDEFLAGQPDLTPYDVAAAVNAAVPPGGLLFVGASNPIRDLDLMALPYPVGERRLVIANRGLSGIDGTVSSAMGATLGRPHTTRAIAYVGDVTFLHDLTGLILGSADERPDLTIVVANDDGGSIFATLEQGAPAFAHSYERLFGTPHGVDLGGLCAALRVPHRRVRTKQDLERALATPSRGVEIVEACYRRDNRRELDAALRALAPEPM